MLDDPVRAIIWHCLLLLLPGLRAEECSRGVRARRGTLNVTQGGSASLSCVVQHCGRGWTGNWIWKNATDDKFAAVADSDGRRLSRVELSANETRLVLRLVGVGPPDEGSYGCSVLWSQGDTDLGHLVTVNVTAAPRRNALHRILVCAGALLWFPVVLGLALCLGSRVRPQPFPGTRTPYVTVRRHQAGPTPKPRPRPPVPKPRSSLPSSHKARPKTEVVYADVSQAAIRQQGAPREPPLSTVYSSVKFS